MNTTRVNRLLERLTRTIQEAEMGPEWDQAMQHLDQCEDLLDEHRQWAKEMMGDSIDPQAMAVMPPSKWNTVDSGLTRIRNVVDSLSKVLKEVEESIKKNLGSDNSVEPDRLVPHLEEYRKFLNQEIVKYQKTPVN